MIFVYSCWDRFCKSLFEKGVISIPIKEINSNMTSFLALKHDIENNVPKAYHMAEIEHKYGHRGSYYPHAYLLKDKNNVTLLQKMLQMGHEISYHYDVMDSNHGNLEDAIKEFSYNIQQFEKYGFKLTTVCQHGNPIVERSGYTSNRDFFRNDKIKALYPDISDVMVNFKSMYNVDYSYYSDAGRKFSFIFDPINNDIINSEDKNIPYENLDELLSSLDSRAIISTHPHRWTKSAILYVLKETLFKTLKYIAKLLTHIPLCRRIMSRYYYLAKRI